MSTTSLFVELLIIGYMAEAWLAVLLVALLGPGAPRAALAAMNAAALLAALIVTSFAYFLGVLMDRVSDTALCHWDVVSRRRLRQKHEPSLLDMQATLFVRCPESVARFGYQQSRLRVVRSGVFNVAFLLASFLLLVATQPSLRPTSTIVWTLSLIGAVIWIGTAFTYWRITQSYWERTRREFLALGADLGSDKEARPAQPHAES